MLCTAAQSFLQTEFSIAAALVLCCVAGASQTKKTQM